MTRDEVIQMARTFAGKKSWPWAEPLLVEERRRFALFGRRYWRVTTNAKYADIGRNVHLQIDDKTGQVLSSEYVSTPQTSRHHLPPPDFNVPLLNSPDRLQAR